MYVFQSSTMARPSVVVAALKKRLGIKKSKPSTHRGNTITSIAAPTEPTAVSLEFFISQLQKLNESTPSAHQEDSVPAPSKAKAVALESLIKQLQNLDESTPSGNANTSAVAPTEPEAVSLDSFITQLRKLNDASLRFSRSCCVCDTDSPSQRAILTECGHAICLECAEWMRDITHESEILCPVCSVKSSFVPLIEQCTEANGQSDSTDFSRDCGICGNSSPNRRAVLTACGHTICMECAECMKKIACDSLIKCPFCRVKSELVLFIEQYPKERLI